MVEPLMVRFKGFVSSFSLALNSVVWFYLAVAATYTMPDPAYSSLRWVFYLAAAVSFIAGPFIVRGFNRAGVMRVWVALSAAVSLLPLVLSGPGDSPVAAVLVAWGVAFGIGFPPCLALSSSLTSAQKRGQSGGAIFLAAYLLLFLLLVIMPSNVVYISIILAAWRCLGFVFIPAGPSLAEAEKTGTVSYATVLRQRRFYLYFIPWLAFVLVNYSGARIIGTYFGESLSYLMSVMEFSVGGLFCLVGGWVMDRKGRKPVIIIGLVMLGLAYALLSLLSPNPFVQAFFIAADSVAFGIFTVAFVFTVWGDMAGTAGGSKYYALGSAVVPLGALVPLVMAPWLVSIGISSAFTLASFFLFLAIIPLFFAPELLPEKAIKDMEIKKYVDEAKKVARRRP